MTLRTCDRIPHPSEHLEVPVWAVANPEALTAISHRRVAGRGPNWPCFQAYSPLHPLPPPHPATGNQGIGRNKGSRDPMAGRASRRERLSSRGIVLRRAREIPIDHVKTEASEAWGVTGPVPDQVRPRCRRNGTRRFRTYPNQSVELNTNWIFLSSAWTRPELRRKP